MDDVARVSEQLASAAWSNEVDEVLAGDINAMLATVTPARGVVLIPLANLALIDRKTATISLSSSLGLWRKLERIERNPRVAIAFHTRAHGRSSRTEYVLLQGQASFSWLPDRAWLNSIGERWEQRLDRRRAGPVWDSWLSVYHWQRVRIDVRVARAVVWPDLACAGPLRVHGAPLPDAPPPQRPPARGTAPRIDHERAAARARRLPHTLLGWVAADGLPMVVPVELAGANRRGMLLEASPGRVPPGGRRAGLTAHWFAARLIGQEQRVHTGWLEPQTDRVLVYAPHTEAGYRLPPSRFVSRAATGFVTRRGLRAGRRAGVVASGPADDSGARARARAGADRVGTVR